MPRTEGPIGNNSQRHASGSWDQNSLPRVTKRRLAEWGHCRELKLSALFLDQLRPPGRLW